jgi:hypothetical protein
MLDRSLTIPTEVLCCFPKSLLANDRIVISSCHSFPIHQSTCHSMLYDFSYWLDHKINRIKFNQRQWNQRNNKSSYHAFSDYVTTFWKATTAQHWECMYRHFSLSAPNWFHKNTALSETALSVGTFPIIINVQRSNLYSQLMLQG